MILRSIQLINFRNYKKINLVFHPNITVFIGKNAQGKTNLLESIYMLAITKSNRGGNENNYIRFGTTGAKIKGTIKNEKNIKDLEIQLKEKDKKVFCNQTEIHRLSEYISQLNVILFTPDDLEIVKGSPNLRRNLLNVELSQVSSFYLKTYNEYNKILKTRNEYLKILYTNHLGDHNYLDILTEKLIDKAILIYQLRNEFISEINEQITEIYYKITGFKGLKVIYEPNISFNSFTEEDIRKQMHQKITESRHREEMQGMTLYGPHRDDFSFYLEDLDLKLYGSQGQQRLAIIAFKLAEISIFYKRTGTYPILLLDDLFSEIDKKKKNELLKYIDGKIQTMITTTDINDIKKSLLENAKIYEVIDGSVIEKVGNNNGRKDK